MHKVNELYGKQVINQANGEGVAAVRDVVLSADAQRIVALVVGGGAWSSDEQAIRWDKIVSIGEYVIVESVEPFAATGEDMEIADLREQAHRITGKTVISSSGERVGTVGDMFFDDRGAIVGYEIKQGGMFGGGSNPILPAKHVRSVGKDAVIADQAELIDHDAAEGHWNATERAVGAPDRLQAPTLDTQPRDIPRDLPPPIGDETRHITQPLDKPTRERDDLR
jgi:sporulation protein YlmC with PRC-barrel domain